MDDAQRAVNAAGVVLITGASRGIGLALACLLSAFGVPLVLTARRADALQRVRERFLREGLALEVQACDAADDAGMREAFARVRKLGALAGVVNNAGVLEPIGSLLDLDLAEFDRHLRTNVTGVLIGMREALRTRSTGSSLRVVNVSSGAVNRAYRGWAAYCSSKASVNMLTRVAAEENSDGSTSFVAVAPGIIETRMQRVIRSMGQERFPDAPMFVGFKDQGMLLHAVDAAVALAWLALEAPLACSGAFLDARGPEVLEPVGVWTRRLGDAFEGNLERARAVFDELEDVGA